MKINALKVNRDTLLRYAIICAGVALNVILAAITNNLDLPIYWDTIGTIAVAGMAGLFPGIATAVLTNVVCILFNDTAVYFGIINVIIALLAVWLVRKKPYSKVFNAVLFTFLAAVTSGVLSAIIQWNIYGGPQNESVDVLLASIGLTDGPGRVFAYVGINILFNIVDKGLSLGVAYLILYLVPGRIQQRIDNSGWKQRPLTDDEKEAIDKWTRTTSFSARKRMVVTVIVMVVVTSLVITWVGIMRYYDGLKSEKTEAAIEAARFAASIVDADMIDEYIRYGEDTPGYADTEEMLYRIRENAQGVTYLYVLKVGREGSTFIFDLDTDPKYADYTSVEDLSGYEPGEFVPIEEAFEPYVDDLVAGREIEPIESDDTWSRVISAYCPVYNDDGDVVCYAGADVSVEYMTDFVKDFVIRTLLAMAGVIVLIIVYGIWNSTYYVVNPIESIGLYVRRFISVGDDVDKLDEAVSDFKTLGIRTNDEIETLYDDLCTLTSNQSEQLRSIKRLSDSTATMQDGLIITMADLVENRDSDTGAHIQKTAAYVEIIVEGLKKKGYYSDRITPQYISEVIRSAPLHDVGKINIPDSVLGKPGKLTDEEFEIMKTHTTAGREILERAITTVGGGNYLKEARNMAGYHHEKWDGTGYPEHLSGEVIPLSARIMAVADVFDALTSARVYKPPFSFEKAVSIIEEGSGTQFDPKCVEAFMDNLPTIRAIYKRYSEEV